MGQPIFETLEDRRLLSAAAFPAGAPPRSVLAADRAAHRRHRHQLHKRHKHDSVPANAVGAEPTRGRKAIARAAVHSAVRGVVPAIVGGVTDSPAGFFPIGVFSQPVDSFATWKSRGVNTLVSYESQGGTVSLQQWNDAAVADGLYMIRQPSGNTSADASNPYLLAWLFQDEPDANGVSAATLAAEYKSAKAADPNIPVFTNFSGGYVLDWQGNMTSAQYKADLASTDWVGSDIYPVTGWNDPSALDAPGDSVAKLSQLSGGKPQFAFIETSNQNLAWLPPGTTGVTPGQFTAELWDSLVQGAHGIVYFPQSFNAFSYDSTPPAVAAAMTTQDARIESIGAVLNSTRDPAGLGLKLSSGLVGDYYSYEGKSYFVVVNMTNTTLSNQSITMTGVGSATSAAVQGESRTVAVNNGTLTDSFAPYSVHIYAVG